jgi:hypothetical protein
LLPYLGSSWYYRNVSEPVLIDMDERGRVSLGRLHPAPGPYLGVVEPDGTVVLRPAAVMTKSQARLLANPELMAEIDAFAADPDSGSRRGRPRRP